MGLLAKTSESSQDARFGPLLIVSTTLNLGLGITAIDGHLLDRNVFFIRNGFTCSIRWRKELCC
jgi:hypothetical protein